MSGKGANTRSDGELVQAVSEITADAFEFVERPRSTESEDKDHGGWIEILDVSAPTTRQTGNDDDDSALSDVIIWCDEGGAGGSAAGEVVMRIHERMDGTSSGEGGLADEAGMSALLWV